MTSKKNWTMRAAVLMLALVLITSCFVGGTFAKYVTSGSGKNSARVAKFGVTIEAQNDTMFKTTYATDNTDVSAEITNSVESSNADKLVAPGTSENGTASISVTGTPEVAVNVAFSLKGNPLKEVFLKAGEYADYTKAATDDTFTLAEDYYPVKFILTQEKQGEEAENVTEGKLSDIQKKLTEVSGNYPANTDLEKEIGTYKLSWSWAFEGDNRADTLLGNLAAGTARLEPVGDELPYSTNVAFELSATVTQID